MWNWTNRMKVTPVLLFVLDCTCQVSCVTYSTTKYVEGFVCLPPLGVLKGNMTMHCNTSWYLHDIFTINNPEFEKYIPEKIQQNFIWKKQILKIKKLLSWI